MVPEKSSIGEISSKISSRPDFRETSSPSSTRRWTSACQSSLPTSQSKLLVWRSRSFGTSRGSEILAKEMRRGARGFSAVLLGFLLVLREAAKRGPSEGSRTHLLASTDHKPADRAGWKHMRADAITDLSHGQPGTQPPQATQPGPRSQPPVTCRQKADRATSHGR